MIAKLTGEVLSIHHGRIVLDVHGVGYLISVRSPFDFVIGEKKSLHTYLAVRENALDLYGFLREDELTMFEALIKLPKIGPKSALQILTQADVPLLTKAIFEQDPVYLSKMSGMSKKTSEKIVLELKDTFEGEAYIPSTEGNSSDADTVDALMALGYSQKDARDALQKLPPEILNTNERIKHALRIIGT